MNEIIPIKLNGLLGLGANCYLIKAGAGFVLIDTGFAPKRAVLEKKLLQAGCTPGKLKLIIITHGHGDHTGNCTYLRKKYGAPVAIHKADAQSVAYANPDIRGVMKVFMHVLAFLTGIGKVEFFSPDISMDETYNLVQYGFDARVVHLPGHSDGSIGILTAQGALFCGDMFLNAGKPRKHPLVTNPAAYKASLEKIQGLAVKKVYPGHGEAFLWEQFVM